MTERAALHLAGFGMDSASLAGPLAQRLAAIRAAGFSQVMLSAADLVDFPGGVSDAVGHIRASGLQVAGFQALRDYEGLAGPLHDFRLATAKSLLEMCSAVAAPLLLVCSSTDAHAGGAPELLIRDLRKLAMLALPLDVKIAYQAVPTGRHVRDFAAAADLVGRADMPNLGLAIDALPALMSATPLDDIELLDVAKILLVQLADAFTTGDDAEVPGQTAGNRSRVFPGEGGHSEQIAELVLRLDRLGYRGDYSLRVDNDDYRQLPPATVAERGRRAALWLTDDVLHRSAPLPGQMRLKPV